VKAGIVEKSGAWFSYNGDRIGQGRENAKGFLKANPALADDIERAIRSNAGIVTEKLMAHPDSDEARDAEEGPDADGVLPDVDEGSGGKRARR
jgi:recombination protein RecA